MAQALRAAAADYDAELTWVGSTEGMEAQLIARTGLPFLEIPAGGLHGVALLNAVLNGWKMARGTLAAWRHMRREKPAAVLTTGGYTSGPVALAARWLGVPILIFVPDIEPAQSIKLIGRFAKSIAVTVDDSRAFLPAEKVVVTGYPLGERMTRWSRESGREALGLAADDTVLLVFGGSRGARSINRALLAHIADLGKLAHIVHVSGSLDWPEVSAAREALPEALQARYHAFEYLHDEMGAAIAAADLVLCRAGASILGEFPYFGLPAVLVPYPHAWRYQRVNANWLAERGAATVIEDAELPTRIVDELGALLADDARRAEMTAAAQQLARPDAAQHVAKLLFDLGSSHQNGRVSGGQK